MSSIPLHVLQGRSGFARDPRFAAIIGEAEPSLARSPADPLKEAFEQGFDEGFKAAHQEAERRHREQEAAREKIELAFMRLDEESAATMAEKLRQTVLALCEEAVMPLAIDPHGLHARIQKAISMLKRAQDDRRILLHPHDLALISEQLPAGVTVEQDASMERGGLRIETADGGIEDGPSHWRRILAEAFREC